jgi:TrmH family RNA methyltransferase
LLTESQRDRLEVVLVSPRNPLNIGAAARALANFGFSRLSVVAPYEPHWREATSAVGAEKLLRNARRTQYLAEAVADCSLVLGTATLSHRKPEQPVIRLPALAPIIQEKLARGSRVALVFGSEKRGLTRDDLALCHHLVEVPTHPAQPSMNLAQAVAVCLYELSAPRNEDSSAIAGPGAPASDLTAADPPATAGDLGLLAEVVAQAMAAANYSPAIMRNANHRQMHLLLRRLTLSHGDARRILGLFRRILWQLRRRREPN